jgi:hypothetical protein
MYSTSDYCHFLKLSAVSLSGLFHIARAGTTLGLLDFKTPHSSGQAHLLAISEKVLATLLFPIFQCLTLPNIS